MLKLKWSLLAAMAMIVLCGTALAEDAKLPTKEELANNNKLFITLATKALHWEEPQDPFHIAGPLYYVGTKGLASFLFATSEGLILLNTGDPTSGPMIEQSIKTLGFDPRTSRS
jgi:metallo-beta-lactamase class B